MLQAAQFESAIQLGAWLKNHHGKPIYLFTVNTTTKVHGICLGLNEVDACSASYQTCDIQMEGQGFSVSLSLHGENVSLHVMYHHENGAVLCSLGERIPLPLLRLEASTARYRAQQEPTAQLKANFETTSKKHTSPYMLLFPPTK